MIDSHALYVLWLIETLVKVSLVMALAYFGARMLRPRWPAASHLVLLACLISVLFIPLLAVWIPKLNIIPVPQNLTPVFNQTAEISTLTNVSPASKANSPMDGNVRLITPSAKFEILAPLWFRFLAGIWLCGFFVVSVRFIAGLMSLRTIRKYGTRAAESDTNAHLLGQISKYAGVNRPWNLRFSLSPELTLPMTWGINNPTVVLPMAAENWPAKQFEAVVLHELAHIRRFDFFSQMAAEAVCAAYWFHPMVWLGARAMRSDAELAADEAVLRSGLKPSEYAFELLKLANQIGRKTPAFAPIGTPAMNNSKIETRLESILRYTPNQMGMSTLQLLAACGIALIVVPAIAAVHARGGTPSAQVSPVTDNDSASSRLKQAAVATILYCGDADDFIPNGATTSLIVTALGPYSKNKKVFFSPTRGGDFRFNLNLRSVNLADILLPAQTPMWVETIEKSSAPLLVAFVDGHVARIDQTTIKKAASWKFKHSKTVQSRTSSGGRIGN